MGRGVISGVLVGLLVVAPLAAFAGGKSGGGGPLSQTSSGISSRSGGSSSSSSSSSDSDASSDDDQDSTDWDDDDDSQTGSQYRGAYVRPAYPAVPALFANPEFDVYGGVMGVANSGTALDAAIAVRSGHLRVFGGNSSFFEEQGDGSTLNVNIYRLGLGVAFATPSNHSKLHLDAGVSGVVTDAESIVGLMAQAEVRHRLGHQVWVDGIARWHELEHDIRAIDVGVGLRLSILRVGYRHMDFNVGPPLRGPELGLALTF